ncbi:histamine H2 receptor-like [Nematostella vectensis]|uniref:histamine H2 receptor-like n=1 Tax=Nematostella vectensis TaxID=45351 RepID=UPI00207793F8|nr:histamine H2 receptor-like [Nematostella vectensis]
MTKCSFFIYTAPFTLLILNLAMSDLIVGIISEPLSVWTHYREAMGWSLPMTWLSQTAFFLCCTASILSLAVLTSDRYLAIAYPIWYRSNVSFKRVGIASFFIWVLSAAFTSIYYYIGFVAYAFIFANIAVFCTIFIVIFAYTRIFYVIRDYVDNQANLHAGKPKSSRRTRLKCKVPVFQIMLMAFLVSYVPASVMIYVMNLCDACSCLVIHWLRDIQFIFLRLPSFRRALTALYRRSRGLLEYE